MVDLCPLLVGGDVCKVADHDDGLLLAIHGRLEVVGSLLILAVSFRLQDITSQWFLARLSLVMVDFCVTTFYCMSYIKDVVKKIIPCRWPR